jgi:hypothetical protein
VTYRNGAQFSAPTGWSMDDQDASDSNTLSTNGEGAAFIASRVLQTSDSNPTFTRTGGDVAIGCRITLRPDDGGALSVYSAAIRDGTADSTTVTFDSATPSAIGDMALFIGFLADNANLGDISGSAPAATERMDFLTGTGSDAGIAVATAFCATTSGTGSRTAVATASAYHKSGVVIVTEASYVPDVILHTINDNEALSWDTIDPASGDLVLVLFSDDGGDDQTTPGGTYALTRFDPGNVGISVEFGAYYRICTGSETGNLITSEATFGVTGEEYGAHVYRIKTGSWHGTTAPECARATAETGTADPAELDPSGWATEATLWLVAVTRDDDDGYQSLGANYVRRFVRTPSGTAGPEIASSWYINEAASENPGTSTHTGTAEEYIAFTIGVRPAGAPASGVTRTYISCIGPGGLIGPRRGLIG